MSRGIPGPVGHGAWRLPGRGRRLACGRDPHERLGWTKTRVYQRHFVKPCPVCGVQYRIPVNLGRIETIGVLYVAQST